MMPSRFVPLSRPGSAGTTSTRSGATSRTTRFLTRLFFDPDSTWILKGGTGLLARVPQHARHTQYIDLHYRGEIERAQTELVAAADRDLGDFFSFDLEQTGKLSGTTSGRKYRVVAYIGDAKFADFQIDAVVDSNMTGVPDHAPGLQSIDIEELPTADYRIYPVVDHLADKLVAMTSTYASNRPSTRYRDLVDIVLIAQTHTVDADALRTAVESERLHRNHLLPERLELPDSGWTRGYEAIARTVAGLDVQDAAEALAIAVSLYRPVFENLIDGTWEPSTMQWSESGRRASFVPRRTRRPPTTFSTYSVHHRDTRRHGDRVTTDFHIATVNFCCQAIDKSHRVRLYVIQ